MNDVTELKRYAGLHARGQGIRGYRRVLDRITTDDEGPGSWTGEWTAEAEALERRGRSLEAARHFAMARFPYAGDPAREEAQRRCVAAFDAWRSGRGIDRLELDLPGGRAACLTTGLSTRERRPVLLLMGGIVAVKEQNAAALPGIARLGMAGVAAEMPGVGENTLPLGDDAWRMISHLLDALDDRADTAQTYAIAFSFSGHLALRCAATDRRIRGVITVGAPISKFFTDEEWQPPQVTVDTLAHLVGIKPAEVRARLRDRALTPAQLSALGVPVRYTASRRDEIIPPGETDVLRAGVADLRVLEHDDVHGSPAHLAETRMWSMAELLSMRGVRNAQSLIISTLWHAHRLRGRLPGPARAG